MPLLFDDPKRMIKGGVCVDAEAETIVMKNVGLMYGTERD